MCGDKPVHKVLIEETQETPDCYWAWWDNERQEFMFTAHFKDMVRICFPYGVEICEEQGEGHLSPVKITILEENVQ